MYPSKTKVKCSVPNCPRQVRQDRLAAHMNSCHSEIINEQRNSFLNFFKSIEKKKSPQCEEQQEDQSEKVSYSLYILL